MERTIAVTDETEPAGAGSPGDPTGELPATRPPRDPFLDHRLAQARAELLKRQKCDGEAALRKRLLAELRRELETPLVASHGTRDLGVIEARAEARRTETAVRFGMADPYTGKRRVRRPRRPREDASEADE